MGTTGRRTPHSLIEDLTQSPWKFEFHQAVRLLEFYLDGDRVGLSSDPRTDSIRFKALANLSFPASELSQVLIPETDAGAQGEVTVTFLGLAAAMGPLPRPFVEQILERVAQKDTATRDFLDIFHHRLIAYHYRAREKHRPSMRVVPVEDSVLTEPLLAIAGIGTPTLSHRSDISDRSLLAFGATLGRPRKLTQGLAGMVQHYFGTPARGVPFQGRWLHLDAGSWTRLSASGTRGAGSVGLGGDLVLGTRAWDQSAAFELQIGPLDLATFQSFLPTDPEGRVPDGARLPPLQSLAKLHAPLGMEVRARLILGSNVAKQVPLSSQPRGPRLGYTSWLGAPPKNKPADHVILPLT